MREALTAVAARLLFTLLFWREPVAPGEGAAPSTDGVAYLMAVLAPRAASESFCSTATKAARSLSSTEA